MRVGENCKGNQEESYILKLGAAVQYESSFGKIQNTEIQKN